MVGGEGDELGESASTTAAPMTQAPMTQAPMTQAPMILQGWAMTGDPSRSNNVASLVAAVGEG